MDEINKKSVIDVKNEELIIKLHLKYSYKDYIRAKELELCKLYKSSGYKKIYTFLKYICIIELAFALCNFMVDSILGRYSSTTGISLLVGFFTTCLWGCIFYHFKRNQHPLTFVLNFKLKSLSDFYKGRSFKEIKRMEIPCSISFYDAYLIKTTPSISDILRLQAEQILELPLSESGNEISYKDLHDLNENDAYIFFYPEVFIPKNQIKEENKKDLKLVMKKIYFFQHGYLGQS